MDLTQVLVRGEQHQQVPHLPGENIESLSHGQQWPADFETLVKMHSPRLIRTLTLITLDVAAAEDAVQEVFLQLYLHWWDPEIKDRVAWLYRVGINKSKDYRRTMTRVMHLRQHLAGSLKEPTLSVWSPEPPLLDILRSLPARQRTAAALYYLGGFSIAQIARAMGISEGAAASHLHKARRSLRKALEE